MSIRKVKRVVRWDDNGFPVVRVNGEDRPVRSIVNAGTDNPKTNKNGNEDFIAAATSLSPHKTSGMGNLCPNAGQCSDTCLDLTGKGAGKGNIHNLVHGARIARTVVWFKAREYFLKTQYNELRKWAAKAERQGKKLCYRGNMLSDIQWERFGVPQDHPDIQFYDYTKNPRRVGQLLDNYWVTFSRDSKKDDGICIELLQEGKNVAIVFDDGYTSGARNLHGAGPKRLPEQWNGFPVFSGDISDRRWEDPKGHVIGLILKAPSQEFRMKALESGFAV
jgi:hypothetical protein